MCVLGGQGLAGGELLRQGSCSSESRIPGTNGAQTAVRETGGDSERDRKGRDTQVELISCDRRLF